MSTKNGACGDCPTCGSLSPQRCGHNDDIVRHGTVECGVGIEELRAAVNLANSTSEDFNCRFTAEQLILILRGYRASGYDYTANQWTRAYLDAALAGQPPTDVDPTTYGIEKEG